MASWPDSFSSSPFSHSKSQIYGEGEQTGNTRAGWKHKSSFTAKQRGGKDPAAVGDEAESGFSSGSKQAQREHWQPGVAGDTWGHLGHGVSGHCRDSQGTKGGAEVETIPFPLG